MTPQSAASLRAGGRQDGFALLMAIFSLLLLAGMIVAGGDDGIGRSSGAGAADPARAREIAAAGLADALSWFRRQNQQPVTTFAPQLDLDADPVINETSDPAVGLMREFEVAPGVWARYEVRLGTTAESYTDANGNGLYDNGEAYSDDNDNGRRDEAAGARDVSALRGEGSAGTVWTVESHGFLYVRPKAEEALGVGGNRRIAMATLGIEIRRMVIAPPAAAGICAKYASRVTIGSRGRVRGATGAGIAFRDDTGTPDLQSGSTVEGSPSTTSVPSYKSGLRKVFGLNLSQLKTMADLSTTDASVVPSDLGEYGLTVIEADIVFNEARPLRGTGVVIVKGDCTIDSGSNSFFNGLLWVKGTLTVRGPCYLRGVFVCQDTVDVRGSGGDYAEIEYDDKIIDDLLVRMGRYRASKSIFELGGEAPLTAGE